MHLTLGVIRAYRQGSITSNSSPGNAEGPECDLICQFDDFSEASLHRGENHQLITGEVDSLFSGFCAKKIEAHNGFVRSVIRHQSETSEEHLIVCLIMAYPESFDWLKETVGLLPGKTSDSRSLCVI